MLSLKMFLHRASYTETVTTQNLIIINENKRKEYKIWFYSNFVHNENNSMFKSD